jgi:hypothetical protein
VKSLGIFAIVLLGLGALFLVYLVVKMMKKCTGLSNTLERKLFFSSFIRYMIVGNLKMNYTILAFLLSSFSFATTIEGVQTIAYIVGLIALCMWPVFIVYFLTRNKEKLEERKFSAKFDALYQGIHTNRMSALIYNAVFCVRRFDIVLVNMIFSPGFPIFNWESHQYVFKNLAFLFVQYCYVAYIITSKPHTDNIFNNLEYFNEFMIIGMIYIMLTYSGIGNRDDIQFSNIPLYITIAIAAIIILVNIAVMIKLTVEKIKRKIARDKLRKQQLAVHKGAIQSKISADPNLTITPLQNFTQMPLDILREDSHESDDTEMEIKRDVSNLSDLLKHDEHQRRYGRC